MEDHTELSCAAKRIILAWTALLKDYTGSSTNSFMLTSPVAHAVSPAGVKVVEVVLREEQGLADLWQQIEGQLDSDSGIEEAIPSFPFQSHIHLEQEKRSSCNVSDAFTEDHLDGATKILSTPGKADVDIYIQCSEHDVEIQIQVVSTSLKISSRQAMRIHHQLLHAFHQIQQPLSNDQMLHHISTTSALDLQQIWQWNCQVKPPSKSTVLKTFSLQVENAPEALAIDAWDGKLTYVELDRLSTALAHQLIGAGAKHGNVIPLCFEKCVWTAVAILAVIKVGAAFVLMDESLPLERLRQIIQEIDQSLSVVVSSVTQLHRAEAVHSNIVMVDSQLRSSLSSDLPVLPTHVEPSDCVYICFTSGSTGVPKGAMIQHANVCAYVDSYAPISGISCCSRILNMASYAFDIAIGNILIGLMSGACICVPSSWECRNDIPKLVPRYQSTHLQTTPSMSMMLDPRAALTLQVLDLCGEPCRQDSIERWRDSATRIMNSYGPAECMPTSVVNFDVSQSPRPSIIGKGLGCCWVVDPMDLTRLMAIGGIGELVLEGPQVGLGYLHDPAKTRAVYIQNPNWLADGYPNICNGRQGTLYRTGDLVRYTCKGEIEYIDRCDFQVKIRGQRVELGEIAAHLQKLIPDHVQWCLEGAKLQNGAEQLIVFVVSPHEEHEDTKKTLHDVAARVHWEARKRLPTAMVPGVYAGISSMPLSPTGKTDRRRLRQLALSLCSDRTFFPQALSRPPSMEDDDLGLTTLCDENGPPGEREQSSRLINDEINTQFSFKLNILRQLWSEVFQINAASIRSSDTFFGLGGESLLAIKLVGLAASKGLQMDVPLIFRHSQLYQQASVCEFVEISQLKVILPFALIENNGIVQELAEACCTTVDNIEDAYPCTPMQEGLVMERHRQTATYTGRAVLRLPRRIDPERLACAWQHVSQAYPIMRTRIVDTKSNGLLQVVFKDCNLGATNRTSNMSEYLQRDGMQKMGLRTELCRWSIVHEPFSTSFVLTMHHSIYDGWTIRTMASEVFKAYQGIYIQPSLCFNQFIYHLNMLPLAPAQEYWSNILTEPANTTFFPPVNSSIRQAQADTKISRKFQLTSNTHGIVSMPSLLRAAWALLAAELSGSQDVTFGATVSGRNVPISGIERLVGPTISTVPVRVRLDHTETVREYIERIQNEALEAIPFENLGLQNIRKISADTRQGCTFNTLFIVQPSASIISEVLPSSGSAELELKKLLLEELDVSTALSDFNEYALLISIKTEGKYFTVEASYDSKIIENDKAELLLDQFAHLVTQISCKNCLSTSLREIQRISDNDLGMVWEWNSTCFKAEEQLIHDVITDSIMSYPGAQAICSWDGSFTYAELDALSTRLAQNVSKKGLKQNQIVPICMEKTKWATVAMLGILKAGAGFVTMDVRQQPKQRLKTIISEVGATCIVTAGHATQLAYSLSDEVIVCDNMAPFEGCASECNHESLSSSPSDTAFVVFTSGSSGVPKGIIITHENFCSTILYHASELKLSNNSRVYDYASYSFDIAVHNALMTLAAGGCLCVPSESDRENDIDASFERLQANWTDITPSVARLMNPVAVPSLKTLVLSGESVGKDLVRRWSSHVDLINAYGPAETQICTIQTQLSSSSDSANIGRGVGCSTWIVDPRSDALLPIGAVGELLIEGPIVSPGYLNAPCDAFIENPAWLTRGSKDILGRSGRLYRTGDLAQYRPDGTIVYLGRANTQTKINGQRIELGEIEYHLREILPGVPDLAVDAITVNGTTHVCAFLVQTSSETSAYNPGLKKEAKLSIQPTAFPSDPVQRLREQLPSYMVPSFFWEISHIPLTPTRKVDRGKLRAAVNVFSAEDILSMSIDRSSEENFQLNEKHHAMIRLWSRILKIDPVKIGLDSDFFQLGGDSISAMMLVKSARNENHSLTVHEIFLNSRLGQLCSVARWSCGEEIHSGDAHHLISPFELLPLTKRDTYITAAAASCNIREDEVVDMYPCSPFQEAVFTQTASDPKAYVQHLELKLNDGTNLDRLIVAWNSTVASNPILRTRIVQAESAQLFQVVIQTSDQRWPTYESSGAYLEDFFKSPMCLGSSLSRLAIIEQHSGEIIIIWTIHHALYDSWTVKLLLRQVSQMVGSQKTMRISPGYNVFVNFLSSQRAESEQRWKFNLDGASSAAIFPKYHADTSKSLSSSTYHKHLHIPSTLPPGYTTATLLRAAWGILMARNSSHNSVLFGEMRFGRGVPIQGIEEIRGPTIAPVPVLMQVNPDHTVESLLDEVLARSLYTQNHEHLGLQNISQLSEDAKVACNFQTILVIQEETKEDIGHAEFEIDYSIDDVRNFNSWSLMIVFHQRRTNLEVEAVFKDSVITSTKIDCLLQQLENLCYELGSLDPSSMLRQLNRCSRNDLLQIWEWNSRVPRATDAFMDEIVAKRAQESPNDLAITAHDGEYTYKQVDTLSSKLATQLISWGINIGSFVAICFEKSSLVPIAMLAVLKAGAAFIIMDVSYPKRRLAEISNSLGVQMMISSPRQEELSKQLVDNILVIDRNSLTQLEEPTSLVARRGLERYTDSVMYVCFTSGSSGTPKGVMISHKNLASALVTQTRKLGFGPGDRLYDFSSHAFDMHIWSTWQALVSGACLCIPSDEDRIENLAGSIDKFGATVAWLTPSVARTIDPQEIPTIKRLFLGGESVLETDVSLWMSHVDLFETYGPAETTPLCMFVQPTIPESAANIGTGRGFGVNPWICNPDDHNELMAIGAVGELILEGPLVGLGYHNQDNLTMNAFVKDPSFLIQGCENIKGRHGTLYKTGDLARYLVDGSIQYEGRANTQVKLRGQRLDFGEIEHHLMKTLAYMTSVVCELVTGSSGRQRLMAFCSLTSKAHTLDTARVRLQLRKRLPSYMIPDAFVIVDEIPRTPSGKADRRYLQTHGLKLMQDAGQMDLVDPLGRVHGPLTQMETRLQELWKYTLNQEQTFYSLNTDFFIAGGDSIATMKLTNIARKHDLNLSLKSINEHPSLSAMALEMSPIKESEEAPPPFSLVKGHREEILTKAAMICNASISSIKDIYPCTPLQTELFALSLKQPNAYMKISVFEVPDHLDYHRVIQAWKKVIDINPILRTRFVEIEGEGLLQVVLESNKIGTVTNLPTYIASDPARSSLGVPLSQVIRIADAGHPQIIWAIHHALYDGWSIQIIEEQLCKAYRDLEIPRPPEYSSFVNHLLSQDPQQAKVFWAQRLVECKSSAIYPTLPSTNHQVLPTQTFKRTLSVQSLSNKNLQSTLLAAWACIASDLSGNHDVVFGSTFAGRSSSIRDIESLVGPTITPLPVRVNLEDRDQPVQHFIDHIKQDIIEMEPHQHIGNQAITQINEDTLAACKFQTLIVLSPSDSQKRGVDGLKTSTYEIESEHQAFHTFGLVMFFVPIPDGLSFEAVFDPDLIGLHEIERLGGRLEAAISVLSQHSTLNQPLSQISCLSKEDLRDIWNWNAALPATSDRLLHSIILDRARTMNATAIDAWDCNLTYSQVDQLSLNLERHLRMLGVGNGCIVPILSAKSGYVPVAALAVLRTGAAFLPLDAAQPFSRLSSIIAQVRPNVILAAQSSLDAATAFKTNIVSIEKCYETKLQGDRPLLEHLRTAQPEDLACVLFTSGSTGTPKGVMQSHQALSSAIAHQAISSGFSETTRAFEFASYGFDVSWNMIFKTLAVGGTLCVPTDEHRHNDLVGALNRSAATLTELTPSVARLINPAQLTTLEVLILSGESVDLREFQHWQPHIRLIVCYGPSECTSVSTMNLDVLSTRDNNCIGTAASCVTWIADPQNHRRLMPIGSVGEILIEGPIVGKGYLNNKRLTDSAYVSDVPWLKAGYEENPGRSSVLFKTGDLARYDNLGKLHFVTRKDTQIKIHGQRIELEEVQHHLRNLVGNHCESIVCCGLQNVGSGSSQVLAAFLDTGIPEESNVCTIAVPTEAAVATVETLEGRLRRLLPAYMIPSVYYFITKIPKNTNGKIDRKRLAALARDAQASQVYRGRSTYSAARQGPLSESEHLMQRLWIKVLKCSIDYIGFDEDFFNLNGDSISAMRLVAVARDIGYSLRVSDVFMNSRLSEMALKIIPVQTEEQQVVRDNRPFEMLGESVNTTAVRMEIGVKCGVEDLSLIEDAYPCTPLQANMLAATVKDPHAFISMRLYRIPRHSDEKLLQAAWASVVSRNQILRTRLVSLKRYGLSQVVVQGCSWNVYSDMKSFLDEAAMEKMGMGTPLAKWAVIDHLDDRMIVWQIHHAIYDGWMLSLIETELQQAYIGSLQSAPLPSIKPYVKFLLEQEKDSAIAFWQNELKDAIQSTTFPALPSESYEPSANSYLEKTIQVDFTALPAGTSLSALIYSTWALLTSILTKSNKVMFGAIVTGRNTPVVGIDKIVGPTITTVPVLVDVDSSRSTLDLTLQLRETLIRMINHEYYGAHAIRQISEETAAACSFKTVLVIQPLKDHESAQVHPRKFSVMEEIDETQVQDFPDQHAVLNQFGLMLEILPIGRSIKIRASFDKVLISAPNMERIINQWGHIMKQFTGTNGDTSGTTIRSLNVLCEQDLDDIWEQNKKLPLSISNELIYQNISKVVQIQPKALAIDAWNGRLSYQELDMLSSRLAEILFQLDVGPERYVPIIFPKSLWANVAMLAVLKAGGAFVPFDADHPEGSLRAAMQSLKADVILCSSETKDQAARLARHSLVVDASLRNDYEIGGRSSIPEWTHVASQQKIDPSHVAYAVFTSGSTGAAKGVKISHGNLVTAISHQVGALGFRINSGTRSLDSSSYAFDACVFNFLYTVASGGCFCVPNGEQLKGDLGTYMRNTKINWAQLVPSVARMLNPDDLPDLKDLILTGEPLSQGDIEAWGNRLRLTNVYGPTECTILCAISSPLDAIRHAGNIGKGKGANLWLTEIDNPNRLVPYGAIGEILIEGPIIGAGYLGPYQYPLVIDPVWLSQGSQRHAGRRGTLFQTGDQARYNEDGTLTILGRIGSETKLRGQRVDLIGIENFIRRCGRAEFDIAADVVSVKHESNGRKKDMLLLFAYSVGLGPKPSLRGAELEENLRNLAAPLKRHLNVALPSYLHPEAFFPLAKMPKTRSGKLDRRHLKEIGKKVRLQQLIWISESVSDKNKTRPSTPEESLIASLWARLLNLPSDSMAREDDFFVLGADSLTVMNLTTIAHDQGFLLNASDIFKNSKLSELAKKVIPLSQKPVPKDNYAPFSLVDGIFDRKDCLKEVIAPALSINVSQIEDVVPANGFQVDYMHHEEEPLGLQYAYLDISSEISWSKLIDAVRTIVQSFQSLRARFVYHEGKYYQVILQEAPLLLEEFRTDQDLTTFSTRFCPQDCRSATVSDIMTKLSLVETNSGMRRVILRMSHMQNDGWCQIRILHAIAKLYNGGQVCEGSGSWTRFLCFRHRAIEDSLRYWHSLLQGTNSTTPALIHKPGGDKVRTLRTLALPNFHTSSDNRRTRPTVVINVAWALVLQKLAGLDDVIFGNVTTGRNGSMPGLDSVIGPCVNMLPMRLRLLNGSGTCSRKQLLRSLVEASAQQVDERTAFEGLDWDYMTKHCTSWHPGVRQSSAVHFRNMAFHPKLTLGNNTITVGWYELVATPYWTTVLVYPEEEVLRIWLLAPPAEIGDEGADEILNMIAEFAEEIVSSAQDGC